MSTVRTTAYIGAAWGSGQMLADIIHGWFAGLDLPGWTLTFTDGGWNEGQYIDCEPGVKIEVIGSLEAGDMVVQTVRREAGKRGERQVLVTKEVLAGVELLSTYTVPVEEEVSMT